MNSVQGSPCLEISNLLAYPVREFIMGTEQMDVYYSSGAIPVEIAENFKELFPEHDEFSFQEILLAQESVYESLRTSGNCETQVSAENGEPSHLKRSESEIALDEAIARSLELEDSFDNLSISESRDTSAGSSSGGGSSSSTESSVAAMRQDTTDPDNMSYEELLELRDTVGTESRGLRQELIARLPTSKHKAAFFSKKKSCGGECVICYMAYKNGEKLITLPCMHMYHSKCITRWLGQSKTCPFCTKEVSISDS